MIWSDGGGAAFHSTRDAPPSPPYVFSGWFLDYMYQDNATLPHSLGKFPGRGREVKRDG